MDREPGQIIDEIRGRWSVSDLREQTDADLEIADDLFYRSSTTMQILEQGRNGLIDYWYIESDGKRYECRRFKNFAFCSCLSFYYSKRLCKHLALTTGVKCERCGVSRARVGEYCWDCDGIVNRFAPVVSSQ